MDRLQQCCVMAASSGALQTGSGGTSAAKPQAALDAVQHMPLQLHICNVDGCSMHCGCGAAAGDVAKLCKAQVSIACLHCKCLHAYTMSCSWGMQFGTQHGFKVA
jgi:hypothetical protein